MNITILIEKLRKVESDWPNASVHIIDTNTAEVFHIKGIEPEHDDDGDGSTTVWLQVEAR